MSESVDPSDSGSSRITSATNTSPKDAATRKREKGRKASGGSSDIKDDIASRMEARLAAMEDRFVTFLEKQMEHDEGLIRERINTSRERATRKTTRVLSSICKGTSRRVAIKDIADITHLITIISLLR